ncbi:MAG: hypothetical protein KBS57_02190 [Alistipes sp.]|nr:hypothetical protein [Candidatus Minthomonas equi]
MKRISLLTITVMACLISACTHDIVVPNDAQKEWADAEIGVMYHFDMQVFNPDYDFR